MSLAKLAKWDDSPASLGHELKYGLVAAQLHKIQSAKFEVGISGVVQHEGSTLHCQQLTILPEQKVGEAAIHISPAPVQDTTNLFPKPFPPILKKPKEQKLRKRGCKCSTRFWTAAVRALADL